MWQKQPGIFPSIWVSEVDRALSDIPFQMKRSEKAQAMLGMLLATVLLSIGGVDHSWKYCDRTGGDPFPGNRFSGSFRVARDSDPRVIRKVSALEAVLIKGIEPILNPLFVYFLIGEKPGPWALVGVAIVFAGVTARSVFSSLDFHLR